MKILTSLPEMIAGKLITASIAGIVCGTLFCSSAAAQRNHELIRGNMVPGRASQLKLFGNPKLMHYLQPVKVTSPENTVLSVVANGGFVSTSLATHTTGMRIGSLYRFRLSNIKLRPGVELYPSVELLDILHPPKGLENEFPVPIVIDELDVKQALAGRLVTKIIYLEDPETSLPRTDVPGTQATLDISSAADPLRAAESLGRPMAILRIGSRVPTASELAATDTNAFRSQPPEHISQATQAHLKLNPNYAAQRLPLRTGQPGWSGK